MNRKLAVTALLTLLPAALADASHGDVGQAHKVSICHATHSEKNPYVLVTIDRRGERAHLAHQDDEDVSAGRNLNTKSGPSDVRSCAAQTSTDDT